LALFDALRPDHLGCYGSARGNSPYIDAMAEEGVVFENAFTVSPVTNVSISTLFTGCLPCVHGVRLHTAVMNSAVPTLAEILKQSGYQTGAVVSCATLDRSRGLARGFDFYDDSFDKEEPKGILDYDPDARTISRHSRTAVTHALEWLRGLDPRKPFFLFIHLFDTHSPYDPSPEYRSQHPVSYDGPINGTEKEGISIKTGEFIPSAEDIEQLHYLYGGELNFTDKQVQRLRDGLEKLDRLENTMTVFTADHGVHLGENGVWGSGRRLYDREIKIPFILHGREAWQGRRVKQLVSNMDMMPTLLDVLDISLDVPVSGQSRLADIEDPEIHVDNVVYTECFMPTDRKNQRLSVRNRRWKWIAFVPDEEAVFLHKKHSFHETWLRIKRLIYRLFRSSKGRKQQLRRALDILIGRNEKDIGIKMEMRDRVLLPDQPELYDISVDPAETKNLHGQNFRVERLMQNELSFFSRRFIKGVAHMEELSEEALRQANEDLRTLGYK